MPFRLLARQHWRPYQACHPAVISITKHAHTRLNNDDDRLRLPPVTEAAALASTQQADTDMAGFQKGLTDALATF
jgi:hypothetical protein